MGRRSVQHALSYSVAERARENSRHGGTYSRRYSEQAQENYRDTRPLKMSSADLTVAAIPEARFDEVIDHLRYNFFADEPLNNAVGLCRKGEPHHDLERHCLFTLKQGYCRMLVTEDGTIAGLALNGVQKKGEREEAERRLSEMNDVKFKTIFGLLYKLNEKIDLFEKYGIDEIFECRILSVDEEFRGNGLANVLMTDSVETAKKAGFKHAHYV